MCERLKDLAALYVINKRNRGFRMIQYRTTLRKITICIAIGIFNNLNDCEVRGCSQS